MDTLLSAQRQNLPPFIADNDVCPICHSDRYLNQNMKLFVSPCYHKMCESCIERLFGTGPAPCPVCNQILRKINFYQQVFEDLTVEKEIRIRARIGRIFNKRRADFSSLREYNDYLEMVEDITFKLLNNENVQEAEDEIQRYSQLHKKEIAANTEIQKREKRLEMLSKEQALKRKEIGLKEYTSMLQAEKKIKKDAKDDLITKLASSDKGAREIVKENGVTLRKSTARLQNKAKAATGHIDYGVSPELRSLFDNSLDDEDMKEDTPIDPFEDSYKETEYINLKSSYFEINSALKNALSIPAGFGPSIYYRRMLDDAFAGIQVSAPSEPEPRTSHAQTQDQSED